MCPYYLDGDLTERRSKGARSVIPVAHRVIVNGVHVATVQFSRAAERATNARRAHEGRRRAGLSKLNSMHPLELDGMPRWPGQVRSTF